MEGFIGVSITQRQSYHFSLAAIWGFPKIVVPLNHPFLIRFSIINHPFWGTLIFGNTHIDDFLVLKEKFVLTSLEQGKVHFMPWIFLLILQRWSLEVLKKDHLSPKRLNKNPLLDDTPLLKKWIVSHKPNEQNDGHLRRIPVKIMGFLIKSMISWMNLVGYPYDFNENFQTSNTWVVFKSSHHTIWNL